MWEFDRADEERSDGDSGLSDAVTVSPRYFLVVCLQPFIGLVSFHLNGIGEVFMSI